MDPFKKDSIGTFQSAPHKEHTESDAATHINPYSEAKRLT